MPRAALAVVVPPKTATIAWDYGDQRDIVFLVRECKTNDFARPAYSWPVVLVTANKHATLPVDTSVMCCWWTVTASNTVNGLESDFACSQ